MPKLDNGVERLSTALPKRTAIGLFLIPAMLALASNDLGISVTPGDVVIDDHVFHVNGRENLAVNDGNTLSASSEVYADVVAYWNPDVGAGFVKVVDGSEALTSVGADAPTDAEVDEAVGSDNDGNPYPWIRLGRVKFARDSGTVITIEEIDHGVRPFGVTTARKAAGTASAAHETDLVGADAELYEFSHTEAISVDLADVTGAGDILTNKPCPLFYGKIGGIRGVVEKAVTTAAKLMDVNAEIGTTNLTGGVVALTSAAATPIGKVIAGTAITGNNTFKPGDTWSLEAANVTAFAEGRARIEVDFYRLRV